MDSLPEQPKSKPGPDPGQVALSSLTGAHYASCHVFNAHSKAPLSFTVVKHSTLEVGQG